MADYIYGARDKVTGKLISDIVSPRRKYWDRKDNAEKAINTHNESIRNGYRNAHEVELVEFELIELSKRNLDLKEHLNSIYAKLDDEFNRIELEETQYLADPNESDEDKDIQEAFYEGTLSGIVTCMNIINDYKKRLN